MHGPRRAEIAAPQRQRPLPPTTRAPVACSCPAPPPPCHTPPSFPRTCGRTRPGALATRKVAESPGGPQGACCPQDTLPRATLSPSPAHLPLPPARKWSHRRGTGSWSWSCGSKSLCNWPNVLPFSLKKTLMHLIHFCKPHIFLVSHRARLDLGFPPAVFGSEKLSDKVRRSSQHSFRLQVSRSFLSG